MTNDVDGDPVATAGARTPSAGAQQGELARQPPVRTVAGVTVVHEHLNPGAASGLIARCVASPGKVAALFVRSGAALGEMRAAEIALPSQTLLIWETGVAFTVRVTAPTTHFAFIFGREQIPRGVPEPLLCRPGAGETPLATVVASCLSELTGRLTTLPASQAEVAVGIVRDMVVRSLEAAPRGPSRSHPDQIIDQLLEHIEQHLQDPGLRPETLAKAYGISLRYLHLLFARRNLRVATWIRLRRLDACRAELSNADDSVTITRVALKWGFNDSSHFSRLFSAAYGVPPLSYYRQARAAKGP